VPPYRLAKDQGVKCSDPIQLIRRHVQHMGNLLKALVRDPASVSLHDLQRPDACPSFLFRVLDLSLNGLYFLVCQHRPFL
jgi:hypothetical protein